MGRHSAIAAACGLLFMVAAASAKPMPGSVQSPEGEFVLRQTNISIQVPQLPAIRLWIYDLKTGGKGTVIGFSDEQGEMLLVPQPRDKGVQPIYRGHTALPRSDGTADIFVVYDLQGREAQRAIERYSYDGKSVALRSTAERPKQRKLHADEK